MHKLLRNRSSLQKHTVLHLRYKIYIWQKLSIDRFDNFGSSSWLNTLYGRANDQPDYVSSLVKIIFPTAEENDEYNSCP